MRASTSDVPVGVYRVAALSTYAARPAASMSLVTGPGYTVTTWMPCGFISARSPSDAAASPAFAAL